MNPNLPVIDNRQFLLGNAYVINRFIEGDSSVRLAMPWSRRTYTMTTSLPSDWGLSLAGTFIIFNAFGILLSSSVVELSVACGFSVCLLIIAMVHMCYLL